MYKWKLKAITRNQIRRHCIIAISATSYAKVKFGKYNAIGPRCQFVSINHDYDYPGLQYTYYISSVLQISYYEIFFTLE